MIRSYLSTAICIVSAVFISGQASACIEVVAQDVYLGEDTTFHCELRFLDGGVLEVADDVTVSILGSITAPRRQIFTGRGAVQLAGSHQLIAFPEWFGADPTGAEDSSDHFQAAVDALVDGGTLLGDSTAVYRLNNDVTIRNSHTIFDMDHATIKGTRIRKIVCDGDFEGHQPGDWSTALRGCIVRNTRFGEANNAQNQFGGVSLRWCIGCGAENILKQGETGSFAMNVCLSLSQTKS